MTRPSILVWHPFVLALYPILLVYTRNAGSIYFSEIAGALLVVSLATLAAWAVLWRAIANPARAGLIVSTLLLVIFSFERNVHVLEVRGWPLSPATREWIVLVVALASFGGWVRLLWCRAFPTRVLTTMANAGSLALLAFLIPGLTRALTASEPVRPVGGKQVSSATIASNVPRSPPTAKPDIYFIVLDAYGRSDVLRSVLGYDNQGFLDRMQRRGFWLADRSTANYCQTALSITATLNGQYHGQLAGQDSKSRLPLRNLIASTEFGGILRNQGYKLVGCASGFGLTDGFPADERLAPALNLSEFNALVLDMTPAWTLLGQGAGRASHQRHRKRILYLFDHLAEVADDPAPTFCLAHVVAPHPPFVFGSDGTDVSGDSSAYRLTDGKLWSDLEGHGGPDDYARHYRAQASYISGRVEQVVDQILGRSATPPVIIIQGDHGPGSNFDSDDPQPNDLTERFGILNLCLIPGCASDRLYPTMTPVNTFRVVTDALFGTGRGLVPDQNFYSSYQTPYRMIAVTAAVAGSDDHAELASPSH